MRRLLVFLAAFSVLCTACNTFAPVAIDVGGREVSQSSVDRELRALADSEGLARLAAQGGEALRVSEGTLDADITAAWLTLLVEQQVIDREVDRRHLEVTDADREAGQRLVDAQLGAPVLDTLPEWLRDRELERFSRRAALVRALGDRDAAVTDEQVRAEYDEQLAQLQQSCPSGEYVAHILVDTRAAAEDVVARIEAGEDFAGIARSDSLDSQSAATGGELFCFVPGQFVPEFSSAAEALSPGEISEPVQTEFGFHVIKLSDTVPFESIEAQVRAALEQDAGAGGEDALAELVARADVDLDPRYGIWRVRDGVGRVTARSGGR